MDARSTLHSRWLSADVVERMALAVEMVRERLSRSTAALVEAGIPYAVVGGHAVAYWVARIDPGATRNTPDVNLIVRRADVDRARAALAAAGFVARTTSGGVLFIDGPDGSERSALRVFVAGEKVREDDVLPTPDVSESIDGEHFRVIELGPLLRMKLTAFRTKDRVHVRDLLDVGAVDASWEGGLAPELAARFQEILEDPNG